MPSTPNFASLLATAHALADRAGAVILPHFRSGLAIDHKGGALFDPVTAADIAAETAIREAIADTHPAHGIVGEEFGASRPEADYCWIIDPIDGTRAFIVGQPLWGTLIGLLRNGTPLLGLMNQPFTGERFWSGETAKLLPPRERRGADHPHPCLRKFWRGAAPRLEPRSVRDRGGTGELRTHLRAPFACDASAATATIIACSRSARSTSWSRLG